MRYMSSYVFVSRQIDVQIVENVRNPNSLIETLNRRGMNST